MLYGHLMQIPLVMQQSKGGTFVKGTCVSFHFHPPPAITFIMINASHIDSLLFYLLFLATNLPKDLGYVYNYLASA